MACNRDIFIVYVPLQKAMGQNKKQNTMDENFDSVNKRPTETATQVYTY
jgi:hypothetical protein